MTARKEAVTLEEAKEQVRKVCVRLGLLHLSFAKTLVNELGERKGKELILKAIKDYATRIGEQAKANVAAQGLDNNPANYQEDLPLYGMHDSMESVEVDGEQRKRAYGCTMAKVWNELGQGKLGRLYCYVDPALGLGAVWLSERKVPESTGQRFKEQYGLPDYIEVALHIAVGWPAIGTIKSKRVPLSDMMIRRHV